MLLIIHNYYDMSMRKILAIIGAIIAGGLGITVVGTAQQASAAMN